MLGFTLVATYAAVVCAAHAAHAWARHREAATR